MIDFIPTLLLLTHAPDDPSTRQGLQFAQDFCQTWQQQCPDRPIELGLFGYGEAALLGNRLIWLPADSPNVAKDWQALVTTYQLDFQLCVSTALARGVTDKENAARHGLVGDNLAAGFSLVGLGELAMHLHRYPNFLQF